MMDGFLSLSSSMPTLIALIPLASGGLDVISSIFSDDINNNNNNNNNDQPDMNERCVRKGRDVLRLVLDLLCVVLWYSGTAGR